MNFVRFVKKHLTHLPMPVGSVVSKVPYGYRPSIGPVYNARMKELNSHQSLSNPDRKQFIFTRVKKIVVFAEQNVDFYKNYYKSHGFDSACLLEFDDLAKIPVVNKRDLLNATLDERSCASKESELVNTGGSSGATLDFYIQSDSVGHEWAHMHKIWKKLGFQQNDIKIVFAGRSKMSNLLEYDSARHQINIDIYQDWGSVADALLKLYSSVKPKYLHGYPSAIFDFVIWLSDTSHELLPVLVANVDGLFLGSEYPSPLIRKEVESILRCKSVSWYGHTERCVLAYEKEQAELYFPFETYGYCETISVDGREHLVGTSYYNTGSPLIRYNTEDFVDASYVDGLVSSFRITSGRHGEYILDSDEVKVFLTALIFGRHHKIFEVVSQIQVQQSEAGFAKLFIVLRNGFKASSEFAQLFDGSNVKINFTFHVVPQPYLSKSGKAPLLIPANYVFPNSVT